MTENEKWIVIIGLYTLALLLFIYKNAKLRKDLILKSDQIREIEHKLTDLEKIIKTRK